MSGWKPNISLIPPCLHTYRAWRLYCNCFNYPELQTCVYNNSRHNSWLLQISYYDIITKHYMGYNAEVDNCQKTNISVLTRSLQAYEYLKLYGPLCIATWYIMRFLACWKNTCASLGQENNIPAFWLMCSFETCCNDVTSIVPLGMQLMLGCYFNDTSPKGNDTFCESKGWTFEKVKWIILKCFHTLWYVDV